MGGKTGELGLCACAVVEEWGLEAAMPLPFASALGRTVSRLPCNDQALNRSMEHATDRFGGANRLNRARIDRIAVAGDAEASWVWWKGSSDHQL